MDTKVVNRGVNGEYNPWDRAPHIDRIFLRGLSPRSYGNGVGLGMADVVHDRLLPAIDWKPTQINALTASTAAAIRTPIHFSTDRECLEQIWHTVGVHHKSELTIGWIANSLELGILRLTENLRDEIERNPTLEILGEAEELEFERDGNLTGLLEAVGARR
jgi:hypothetical protein